jgi:hypothetical protein
LLIFVIILFIIMLLIVLMMVICLIVMASLIVVIFLISAISLIASDHSEHPEGCDDSNRCHRHSLFDCPVLSDHRSISDRCDLPDSLDRAHHSVHWEPLIVVIYLKGTLFAIFFLSESTGRAVNSVM